MQIQLVYCDIWAERIGRNSATFGDMDASDEQAVVRSGPESLKPMRYQLTGVPHWQASWLAEGAVQIGRTEWAGWAINCTRIQGIK